MIDETKERISLPKARDYAMMHTTNRKYDEIVRFAEMNYTTDEDRKAFVIAVLDENIRIDNDMAVKRRDKL